MEPNHQHNRPRNKTSFWLRPVKNERGVAIMLAITAMVLMTFIAVEVAEETATEYSISATGVNRLKAYYAAKAGVEISLLRVLIYKKALAAYGSTLGEGNESMLDPIWNIPFSWPPILGEEVGAAEKGLVGNAVKESLMQGQFAATIESEGSKVDINDLGSPSKSLQTATKKQIIKIFQTKVENDDEFNREYGTFNFEELVNNMIDWIDEDSEALNGGDEKSYYSEIRNDFIPPNTSFKTLDELHMVAGMNDVLAAVLKNRITLYGSKGVNINYSDKDVLMGMDEQITEEIADAIIERRDNPEEGGPFKSQEEFLEFLEGEGVRTGSFNSAEIPIRYGNESNFKIISTGTFGKEVREITAITFDFENIKNRYYEILKKDAEELAESDKDGDGKPDEDPKEEEKKDEDKDGAKQDQNKKKEKITPPKGRPMIVFWHEK